MILLGFLCMAFAATLTNVNGETTMMPTGNGTHHHHESNEMEQFSFNYDGRTHMLLVVKGSQCYIWRLTDLQKQMVHTDDGLRQIEIQVIRDIDSAMYTTVPRDILSNSIQQACGHKSSSFFLVH
ncbi:hypothetical protein ACF0H5_013318 [Mactra antiquata]